MSLPPITRKATLKVIAKAKKAGIELQGKIPDVFLEDLEPNKAGFTAPQKAGPNDTLQLLKVFKAAGSDKLSEDERYYIEALIAAHLKDMEKALQVSKVQEKKKSNWVSRLKFILLAIAGTIFFGCEGFDGVTALLGVFNLPTVGIFVAGTVFSVLSILVFYAFDLVEISHNLGVNLKSAPKMVDLYTKELESIKALRIKINSQWHKAKTPEELEEYLKLVEALKARRQEILDDVAKLEKALDRPALKMAKFVTAAITGVIFFSGGFFAGQTVALAIAGLFVSSISATFWPIILVSVAVGFAALAVYWFVERPGIENLIGRMIGLDKEKIEKLTDKHENNNENQDLESLLEHINDKKNQLNNPSPDQQAFVEEKRAHEETRKKHQETEKEHVNVVKDLTQQVDLLRAQHNEVVIENKKMEIALNQKTCEVAVLRDKQEEETQKAAEMEKKLKEAEVQLKQLEETKKLLERAREDNLRLQSMLEKQTEHANELDKVLSMEKQEKTGLQAKVYKLEESVRFFQKQAESKIIVNTQAVSAESAELVSGVEKEPSPVVVMGLFASSEVTNKMPGALVLNASHSGHEPGVAHFFS